jgi:hypothetical protein
MKASKNAIARQLTYKTVVGILPVLERFADALGVTDIHLLSAAIRNMSCDQFCDYPLEEKK